LCTSAARFGQNGVPAPLKTANARRSVVLMPTLGRLLREHLLRSQRSLDHDAVFCRPDGTPLMQASCRYVTDCGAPSGAEREPGAATASPARPPPHLFASLLIAQGAKVVFKHAKRTSDLLEAGLRPRARRPVDVRRGPG
jgi:hypothetical protein